MNNNFDVYLRYMIIIFFTILGLFYISFLFIRKKRIQRLRREDKKDINSGSVGIFFDQDQNVTIIPYVKDKYGVGRALGYVRSVKNPYRKEMLGSMLRDCMHACQNGTPCTDDYLMKLLGFNGWRKFTEGKRNMSVNYKEGTGIIFNATKRTVGGAYHLHSPSNRSVIPGDAVDDLIGETILKVINYCR